MHNFDLQNPQILYFYHLMAKLLSQEYHCAYISVFTVDTAKYLVTL